VRRERRLTVWDVDDLSSRSGGGLGWTEADADLASAAQWDNDPRTGRDRRIGFVSEIPKQRQR
jgi:hypothetical protein